MHDWWIWFIYYFADMSTILPFYNTLLKLSRYLELLFDILMVKCSVDRRTFVASSQVLVESVFFGHPVNYFCYKVSVSSLSIIGSSLNWLFVSWNVLITTYALFDWFKLKKIYRRNIFYLFLHVQPIEGKWAYFHMSYIIL